MVRNRYGNIQPWDNSRIRLNTAIGGSDYINASPIKLRSIRRTSRSRSNSTSSLDEYRYIATQGPKVDQFSHFWHMVMQEIVGPVGVIVMLTQTWESNKEKCGQYFPVDADQPILLPAEKISADSPNQDGGKPTYSTLSKHSLTSSQTQT
jgi:protein-tyrosine phosphatase